MLSTLASLFAAPAHTHEAHACYANIVSLARNPKIYTECKVEDSLDGRFDAIVLHLFLYFDYLRTQGGNELLEQEIAEAFFADMDRSLREMGVSDTGVGKRIKKMASAYFGRMKAYGEAINDDAQFRTALERNLYREAVIPPQAMEAMLAYIDSVRASFKTSESALA